MCFQLLKEGNERFVSNLQKDHDHLNLIKPAISKSLLMEEGQFLFNDKAANANVENSMEEILERSRIIRELFSSGEIGIIGGVYDVDTGVVDFFKNLTNRPKTGQ
ncbi:MAG: hypothetical protein PHD73_03500 [Sediminibacterium sp.]|nr:hypothetical protein [Sediminibacterium sp.]